MNPAPAEDATRSLLNPPSEPLSLQIRGGPRDGQRLRIASPKCLIGSAAVCTLRLNGQGIQPVHCAILRGAARTVVRRWSADTRLNGTSFLDAVLTPGDVLGIGPVQFEVLKAESGSDEAAEIPAANRRESDEQCSQGDEHRRQSQDELDQREARLDAQIEQLAAAVQELQIVQRQSAATSHELAGAQAQFINQRQWLDQQCADLNRRRDTLQQEMATFNERQAQVEREQTAVDELRDALTARSKELDAREAKLTEERLTLEQQIDLRRKSLVDEISAQRQALQTDVAAAQAQLDQERERLDSQCAELALERNAWEEQPRDHQSPSAAMPSEAFAEPPAEEEPAAETSALSTARFLIQDDAADEHLQPPDEDIAEHRPARAVSHSPPPAEGDEEESVEAYMQRLIQRVAGGSTAPAASQAPPTGAHSEPSRVQSASVSERSDIRSTQSAAPAARDSGQLPVDGSQQVVRRANPVLPSRLADMRNLANISARSAIAKHQLRSGKQSMFTSLFLATLSIGSGLALFFRAAELGGLTFLAGMAVLSGGLYFLVQFANGRRMRAAAAKTAAWSAEPGTELTDHSADASQPAPLASDG